MLAQVWSTPWLSEAQKLVCFVEIKLCAAGVMCLVEPRTVVVLGMFKRSNCAVARPPTPPPAKKSYPSASDQMIYPSVVLRQQCADVFFFFL